jgi:hypothetical protein
MNPVEVAAVPNADGLGFGSASAKSDGSALSACVPSDPVLVGASVAASFSAPSLFDAPGTGSSCFVAVGKAVLATLDGGGANGLPRPCITQCS